MIKTIFIYCKWINNSNTVIKVRCKWYIENPYLFNTLNPNETLLIGNNCYNVNLLLIYDSVFVGKS
jgi:hypothetical protein